MTRKLNPFSSIRYGKQQQKEGNCENYSWSQLKKKHWNRGPVRCITIFKNKRVNFIIEKPTSDLRINIAFQFICLILILTCQINLPFLSDKLSYDNVVFDGWNKMKTDFEKVDNCWWYLIKKLLIKCWHDHVIVVSLNWSITKRLIFPTGVQFVYV